MDAGLSFNQGMVVGRAHSKKLLPGLLGVRTAVRTEDGYSYVRSDDIFKSLGWQEKEINDLVRHASLENAIVSSQILKYSGIGPEKTGFNQFFKVIGTVTHVVDGDTFDVLDVITNKTFRVRFDGINTAELAQLNINAALSDIYVSPDQVFVETENTKIFNPLSSAGRALFHTAEAVVGKLVVLRIGVSNDNTDILTAEDLEAGASANDPKRYEKAIKSGRWETNSERYMATIFYKTDLNIENGVVQKMKEIFKKEITYADADQRAQDAVRKLLYPKSAIETNFNRIYNTLMGMSNLKNYFEADGTLDPLYGMSDNNKRSFSALVAILILARIYDTASQWPLIGWDEYYNDGTPYTLNWELVQNGLAVVYTKGLLYADSPALQKTSSLVPTIRKVG